LGCGSIGSRHARNLCGLGVQDLVLVDPEPGRADAVAGPLGCRAAASVEEGLNASPALALVCTPPDSHIELARICVDAGCDVFVEKPMAPVTGGIEDLLRMAEQGGRLVCVGYNLRFHDGVRRGKDLIESGELGRLLRVETFFGQYLPDWRPGTDYRKSYTGDSSRGGGLLFDCSHELDYARWFAGEVRSVSCSLEKLGDLEITGGDSAEVVMAHEGGVISHTHLDVLQRRYSRGYRLNFMEGTAHWDIADGLRYAGPGGCPWRKIETPQDYNHCYVAQMRHLLTCIDRRSMPLVDGKDGLRAVELALAAEASSRKGRVIHI